MRLSNMMGFTAIRYHVPNMPQLGGMMGIHLASPSWQCYLELSFDFLLRDELLVGRQGLCTRLLLILDLCNLCDEHCPVALLLVELLTVLALVLHILESKLQG